MTYPTMDRNEDRCQRILIERPPPSSWRAICAWALATAAGIALGLTNPTGLLEVLALALFILGGPQVLRGLVHMAWLGLGGADQPVRTFLTRWFGG